MLNQEVYWHQTHTVSVTLRVILVCECPLILLYASSYIMLVPISKERGVLLLRICQQWDLDCEDLFAFKIKVVLFCVLGSEFRGSGFIGEA